MHTVAWAAPTAQSRFTKDLIDIERYVEELRETGDPELSEPFSAACLDVLLDMRMMLDAHRAKVAREAEFARRRRAARPEMIRTVKSPKLPTGTEDD